MDKYGGIFCPIDFAKNDRIFCYGVVLVVCGVVGVFLTCVVWCCAVGRCVVDCIWIYFVVVEVFFVVLYS
jgi:hypothetical protein